MLAARVGVDDPRRETARLHIQTRAMITMSKTTKALKKQAAKAQLVAQRSADAFVAEQMSTLAQAFRAQAEVLKRKRKKKK